MPKFKAAIFDLDGTLFDSMWVWEKIDVDFLGKRGIPVPDDYANEISAKSFRETALYTVSRFGLEEKAEDIMDEWTRMAIEEYSHNIPLKPHAKEYLTFLKKHDIRIGTATTLTRSLCEPALISNGIYDLFDEFAFSEEVSSGKESPEIYLLAAEKLGVRPRECIAFEDLLPGIRAILAAGMHAYGVYDSYSSAKKKDIQKISDGYIYDFAEMM